MTIQEQLNEIKENKARCVHEQNFEEACKWREKEVDFMMENFQVDIRSQIVKDLEKSLPTNIVGIIKNK